jgi:hypothetical protein
VNLIVSSLSIPNASPSVAAIFDDVELYVHSNAPVTDTSATAYDDILAAATRADEVKSKCNISNSFYIY